MYVNLRTFRSESTNIPYQNPVFETQYGETRFIDGQIWSVDEYVATVMGDQTCNFGLNPIDGRIKCYGTMDPRTGSESELFVRYVRGSTSIGVNSFTADADIVTDAATGLQWMKNDSGFDNSGEGFDWAGALDYCESLTLGGRSDWRLPDAHELHVRMHRGTSASPIALLPSPSAKLTSLLLYNSRLLITLDLPTPLARLPLILFSRAQLLSTKEVKLTLAGIGPATRIWTATKEQPCTSVLVAVWVIFPLLLTPLRLL